MSAWLSRVANKLRALGQLRDPRVAWGFLRAFGFAVLVPFLVRLGLPRLGTLLERRFPKPREVPLDERDLEQLLRPVDLALGLFPYRCLGRGLTRYYFLRRAGVEVTLCFGIRLQGGGCSGHAWLERGGVPYLESNPKVRYAEPIYQLPAGTARTT